jgi:HAE1 family hydrophobic/amphiphilic exporter-1
MFLTKISVKQPVFATMMMLFIVIIGLFSYLKLGVDQYPKIDVPVVVVITTYPGASPGTVETDVSRRVEEALNSISGMDELTSTSYEGRSVVVAQFKLEVDGMIAAQDVRDKVSSIEQLLPDGVDKPRVVRYNPTDRPIISVALSSNDISLPELTEIADQKIVKRLNIISGVGQSTVVGGQSRQYQLLLNKNDIEANGLSIEQVISSLKQQNQNFPSGSIKTQLTETTLQLDGRIDDPKDFMNLVVAKNGDLPIYVRDIATFNDGSADAESRALLNGLNAISIDIVKSQEANTVDVAKDVKDVVKTLNQEYANSGLTLRVIADNSLSIEESVEQVQSTLIEGALLAVAIVFIFLGSWRSTVITGLTLPISIIGTFAVIQMLGFTLNTMSLLALTLSIGILVDDAIVVRENITRHLHMGKNHFQAAIDGTNEIGIAVLATTATIIAVFLPVAFMDGIIGRFFFQFGVTVSVAVLISLFVSFTLDPMLSSVWYDPDSQPNAKRGPIGRIFAKFEHAFDRLTIQYVGFIKWTLVNRKKTLSGTLLIFLVSLYMVKMVGVEFAPKADQGRFEVEITGPTGSSLDYTTLKIRQVEKALKEIPEVASTYSTINTGGSSGKHKGKVQVELLPFNERTRSTFDIEGPLRQRLALIPGIESSVTQEGVGGRGKSLQISFLGDDDTILEKIASGMMAKMAKIDGIIEIESSAEMTSDALSIRLRHDKAADLGVNLSKVAGTIPPLIKGEDVTTWTASDGVSYDIVVRLPEEQRSSIEDVENLLVSTDRKNDDGTTQMVRLNQFADIVLSKNPLEIRRSDMAREVKISANVSGRPLGEVTADIDKMLNAEKLPSGYRHSFGGEAKNMAETIGPMVMALSMAVIFIYIVLASQFGSFVQPLAIMAALPLSLIGVILGLLASGSTFNLFSLIGFIMLMGLVTKNGILLIDFANQESRRGTEFVDALVKAGSVRFRPIIMTTLAMIFGMIPLAMVMAGGGAQRAPMAHAVIGGLISSTILTLVVVPVMASYLDQLSIWAKTHFKHPDQTAHE